MWKKTENGLVHVADKNRIKVQVRINKDILEELHKLAEEHYSTVSYLIENGIENMLKKQIIHQNNPRDIRKRKSFRLVINKELYEELMSTAKTRGIKRSDMLEDSINYIKYDEIKDKNWRYRIE